MNRFSRVVLLLTIAAILGAPAPSSAWPIPDTGQTQCYVREWNGTKWTWSEGPCPQPGEPLYGQDGNYLINAPSYTKLDENGNDLADDAIDWVMVRDNVTGLIWEVKTDDGSIHDKDNTYMWHSAQDVFIAALNNTEFGGHSDWRLPNIKELKSIVNYGSYNPSINTFYFPSTVSSYYWSSTTTYADYSYEAWFVNFYNGPDGWSGKSNDYYVRAVRGGQPGSFGNLVLNNDGTVTDTSTGLMWQQNTVNLAADWSDAVFYCETLDLSDYDDWRLPTIKELGSIVDHSAFDQSINTFYFPGTMSSSYWSSTTYANDTDDAWRVHFYHGYARWAYKSNSLYVRAVRGGQPRLLEHLFILVPAQGSAWKMGDSINLLWEDEEIAGSVRISVSRQGGIDGSFDVIEESTDNDGEYSWTVTEPVSVNCVLKIEPLDDVSKGTNQGLFTIYECPIVTSNNASFIKSDAATLNGTVNPNSLPTTVTFEWGTDKTYGNEISAAESPLAGETPQSISADLKDLEASTTYHYRIKAASNWCTIYGGDQTFDTNEGVIPVVVTAPVTSITSDSALSGGEVSSDGGLEVTSRGVCWSTSANPTISDTKTSDGTGVGSFASYMEGLSVTTTYHVRAYATNSEGTAYGSDQMFVSSKLCVTCVSSKTELQNALDRAGDNEDDDIIRIVQGTYYGNFTYTPTDADDQANSLTLEGGYTSNCTSRVIDPTNTVIDGSKDGRVLELITQGKAGFVIEGITIRNGNSYFGAGLFSKTDGHITLKNNRFNNNTGWAAYGESSSTLTNNEFTENTGGGAWFGSNSILSNNTFTKNARGAYVGPESALVNNIFTENTAQCGGGAFVGSNSTLTNNTFTENTASGSDDDYGGHGGGAYVGSNSTLINNTFTRNIGVAGFSLGCGGGVYVKSNCTLSNNIFTENSSDMGGGACIGSNSTLTNNVFRKNTTTTNSLYGDGGALAAWNSTIINNTFTENESSSSGGGIFAGNCIITNNIFMKNSAGSGGGVYSECDCVLNNNTFVENTAAGGGGLYINWPDHTSSCENSNVQIFNNIVWKNTASGGSDIFINNPEGYSMTIDLFNNDFDQSPSGIHMVVPFPIDPSNLKNQDPVFIGDGDYHLTALSPCINTGNNNAPNLPQTDKDGNPRIVEGIVDIGAYEASAETGPYIYVSHDGICGGKIPCHTSVQSAINVASNGTIIRVAQGIYTELMTLNESKTLMLLGGWDTSFKEQTGTTILRQAPKAPEGSLRLKELRIIP